MDRKDNGGTTCARCGASFPEPPEGGGAAGYGVNGDTGDRLCYACCADDDRAYMIQHGRWTGYLTLTARNAPQARWLVSNWPGSLEFRPRAVQTGKHNIARVRRDAWFNGPDGYVWHAVQYGDNTDLAHCKRTRRTWNRVATRIPVNYEVRALLPGHAVPGACTCGTCGLSWDDRKVTSMTPTPSARCPFEYFHAADAGNQVQS